MNVLDYILAGLLILFVIQGVRKGFIISLATLVALVLGIWASVHFSNYMDKLLTDHFHPSGTWLPILSFTLIFFCVVILVLLIAKGIEKLISMVGMGILNRIAGGLFGLIKGIIFISVLIFIFCKFDTKEKMISKQVKEKSIFLGYLEPVFPFIIKVSGTTIKFPGNP